MPKKITDSHSFSIHLCAGVYSNLEPGLQELSAGDDVGDLSLIQPVSYGWTSQCGVKGDHCNTHTHKNTIIKKICVINILLASFLPYIYTPVMLYS